MRAETPIPPSASFDIENAIRAIPRVRLVQLPTPLTHLPRASDELGIDLWIKRDDLTELAVGGNKGRILEFSIPLATAEGADMLVAVGFAQSNHVRQIAAAAIRTGIDAHLVCCTDELNDAAPEGNFMLDRLMGVSYELVEVAGIDEIPAVAEAAVERLRSMGRRPAVVTGKFPAVVGTIAYINAGLEIIRQFEALEEDLPTFIVACSTACTQAGLAATGKLLGKRWQTIGFAAANFDRVPERMAEMALAAVERLGMAIEVSPVELWNDDGFVGERYGAVTPAAQDAIEFLARTEAIFLDPLYSGKAFGGLMSYVTSGRIPKAARVLFVHTGGLPILFEKAHALSEKYKG